MFVFDSLWAEEPTERESGRSHQFSFRCRDPLAKFILDQTRRNIQQTRVLSSMLRLAYDVLRGLGPLMHALQIEASIRGVSRGEAIAAIVSEFVEREYPDTVKKARNLTR